MTTDKRRSEAVLSTFRREAKKFRIFLLGELKPKGPLLTPFNLISVPIILTGIVILVVRFTHGLDAVTHLDQDTPWGLWKGLNVVTGVALAGGAYVITFAVHVMRLEKYESVVRVTVLNGLLSYVFYAGALALDLGRPWKIINPIIGNEFGYNSVLFLVAWHFMLYMIAEFLEFSPVVAEWAGWRKLRRVLNSLTLGAVIFGVTLSSLHQSGLGALFLMAKPKIHPLWYSEFIPIFFLVSSVFAGLSMIIVEGTISQRVFRDQIDAARRRRFEEILLGLGKGASISLFVYYFFKLLTFIHERQWALLTDGWGAWYLVEVLGFVLIPCALFAHGVRNRSLGTVRVAAVMALIGIVLNRLNTSVIAYNWTAPVRYYPSWQEVVVSLTVVLVQIWVFRWIVLRMPVLRDVQNLPSWGSDDRSAAPAAALQRS